MMNIPSECMINNFNPNHAMILKECGQKLWVRAGHPGVEEPDHRHRRLLPSRAPRLGREQQAAATHQCDELTPLNIEHWGLPPRCALSAADWVCPVFRTLSLLLGG